MKRLDGILIASFLAILATEASGQTSQQYALMGRKVFAAFTCSALSTAAGKTDETKRLFNIGYEQGTIFINALQSGKITNADLNNQVPMGVLFVLYGPTVDFILGRIYEVATDETLKDIFKSADESQQKMVAQTTYTKMNCSLM